MDTAVSIESSPQSLPNMAAQFALLADPLRLRIIECLVREQLCTCQLIAITGAKQTTVTHHLRVLREADMVLSEAEGRFTWYRLAPGAFTDGLARLQRIAACDQSTPRQPMGARRDLANAR